MRDPLFFGFAAIGRTSVGVVYDGCVTGRLRSLTCTLEMTLIYGVITNTTYLVGRLLPYRGLIFKFVVFSGR